MFYIRRKKQDTKVYIPKPLHEEMHISDATGITKLTEYIVDCTEYMIKTMRAKNSYIKNGLWKMKKLDNWHNPCDEWLDSETFEIYFKRSDEYNKMSTYGYFGCPNTSINDKTEKIENACVTVCIPEDIFLTNGVYDKFIDSLANTVQHELTHAISWWRTFLRCKGNETKKNPKPIYNATYDYAKACEYIFGNDNVLCKLFYCLCEDERNSMIAGYYQDLIRKKKLADKLNRSMPKITEFFEYGNLLYIEEQIDKLIELYNNIGHSEFDSRCKKKFPDIDVLNLYATLFNVYKPTYHKMLKNLKKITEKEKRKYQKLWGVVKVYGEIPPHENLF